jgi:uncharacterized surface protein with fasciclin (FAS1) repeats
MKGESEMKKVTRNLLAVVAVLLLVLPAVAAAQTQTIVEIAVADGRFDTLVAAVKAAGLVDALSGGEWTVFAPTDDAFAKLGLNAGNVAGAFSKAELTDILLYHVLDSAVTAEEAKASTGDIVMANGKLAGLKYFDGDLYVNDDSLVIIPNIFASNGVIHVVDTVILPPWPRTAEAAAAMAAALPEGATIVDVAVGDNRFETLVAAVVAADLVDALSGGEWTVFAPTDDAFAKLGLNAANIARSFSKAELTDILLYHVLDSAVTSAEAKASAGDIVMGNGKLAGLKYYDGNLYVNDDSMVIIPDIAVANGVIHVVDTVILPPWPRESAPVPELYEGMPTGGTIVDIAVADGRFTTLVAAVKAAGLVDALSGGEWTVFAPTDDAFAKLDLNAHNIASAFTKAELTDILLYHVLDSAVTADDAKASTGDIAMGNGKLAGLKVFDGDLYVNDDSLVIIPNIYASNGVIHVVDTVILGPWPK